MIWVILFIIFFFVAVHFGSKSQKDAFNTETGFNVSDLIDSGTYVSGHHNLNNPLKDTSLLIIGNEVKIFQYLPTGFTLKAKIDKSQITNVYMEDSSTIQNRVTVGRLLLTGVFAFAWKKKTKQECAYFVIEWNHESFKNETIFEFEGSGSISKANTLRNRFIAYLTNSKSILNDEIFDERILMLINNKHKIIAVKECMNEKGMTLKEAKNYVDNLSK